MMESWQHDAVVVEDELQFRSYPMVLPHKTPETPGFQY
jgi:hypothetical protein